MQGLLIGFDGEQVIGAQVLDDQARGFLVGVQGIEHDHLAAQILALVDFFQERARGPDLVGFIGRAHGAQPAATLRADRAD